jgi:hypothetical protein
MTLLIAGSILLIAGSAVALGIGWITASETLIWTSMAASVGTAILLAIAYARSRGEVRRATRAVERSEEEPVASRHAEKEEPVPVMAADVVAPTSAALQETRAIPAKDSVTKPASKNSRPATKKAAPAKSKQTKVVAVPERKKFHKPTCRYAKQGEHVSRADAVKRGFSPCGTCKP